MEAPDAEYLNELEEQLDRLGWHTRRDSIDYSHQTFLLLQRLVRHVQRLERQVYGERDDG